MQSAYKPYQRTETSLLCIKSDISTTLETNYGGFLPLIDLSATFDIIVDHDIPLNFLNDTIGVNGKAWNWSQSYLTGCTQQVSVDNVVSELTEFVYGVPQRSVMEPIMY